jgi:hypothetical protein
LDSINFKFLMFALKDCDIIVEVLGGSKMLKLSGQRVFSLAEYAECLLGKAKFYLVFSNAKSLMRARNIVEDLGFVATPSVVTITHRP